MFKKSKHYLLLILLLLVAVYFFNDNMIPSESDIGFYEIHFCPEENCEKIFMGYLNESDKIKCAFYDINLNNVTELLKRKNAEVLIFEENKNKFDYAIPISSKGLMHNKFCILDDDVVITGSMNPTFNGAYKNNNNLFIIKSKTLVNNYDNEFDELQDHIERKTIHEFEFTDQYNETFIIENYFCPEDNCESQILEELSKANFEIIFMTFTFTSDPIGDLLVQKNSSGVVVKGIFEARQKSEWWEYNEMLDSGMNVTLDHNPNTMHHKVFVIDGSTVIFGSMNPTASATTKNDENILIVHNQRIASRFLEEYRRIN